MAVIQFSTQPATTESRVRSGSSSPPVSCCLNHRKVISLSTHRKCIKSGISYLKSWTTLPTVTRGNSRRSSSLIIYELCDVMWGDVRPKPRSIERLSTNHLERNACASSPVLCWARLTDCVLIITGLHHACALTTLQSHKLSLRLSVQICNVGFQMSNWTFYMSHVSLSRRATGEERPPSVTRWAILGAL